MTGLGGFRKRFPQYDDLDDASLAAALHRKFYGDIHPARFSQMIGLATERQERGRMTHQESGFARGLNEPVVDRAGLLPLGRTERGDLRVAWPQAAVDTWDALNAVANESPMEYGPDGMLRPSDRAIEHATNLAGAVTLGAGAMPAEAGIGMGLRRSGADYRGVHRAPNRRAFFDESAASLDDLTKVFPDDVYGPNGLRYYGHGGDHAKFDKESMRAIMSARGNPDAVVTVYRALPGGNDINAGDWVTLSRGYAEEHAAGRPGSVVVSKRVRAGDLFNDANSINEFGWDPTADAIREYIKRKER